LPAKSNSQILRSSKDEVAFSEIVELIAAARERAVRDVNVALIELYWKVGEIIRRKIEAAEWGDAVVDRLAQFIVRTESGLRGFTRRNLFRMRQFYEAYREDKSVAIGDTIAVVPPSHHSRAEQTSGRAGVLCAFIITNSRITRIAPHGRSKFRVCNSHWFYFS
jgi:hypothetical protein